MNHQRLCWNVHCVANLGLRKRLNPCKRGFKIFDLLVFNCAAMGRARFLKVKYNKIWTIFLWAKNLHKIVSYTNMKQNQLLKINFVRPVAPKMRKTDDFRELHENEPEMAVLEWKRNGYL